MLPVLLSLLSTAHADDHYILDGNVHDTLGGPIPDATVALSAPGLAAEQSEQTDEEGYFRFERLSPGEYTLTITSANGEHIE